MNWYSSDIPTMQRKVENYKHVRIPNKDPFLLFKIVNLPNNDDLHEYCNFDHGRDSIDSRMSAHRP